MGKIYRRYNTVQHNTTQKPAATGQKPNNNSIETSAHTTPMHKPQQSPQSNKPLPHPKETANIKPAGTNPVKASPKQKSKDKTPYGPLLGLIPRHIYNPDTKKILGVLSSEDLLLIALIFLFLESSDDDNPLMVLALVYVLLGEYIDFGDFAF